MKSVVCFILLITACQSLPAQTGADCASAIPLTLDGVCRTYATSSTTGPSLHCTDYTGNAPVTYFSFTTTSTPGKPLLNIYGPGGQPVEVVMQPSNCSYNYSTGYMCFDDGAGLWAPTQTFTAAPNTTYKLRIRTAIAGSIIICAQYYTPVNDNCVGAFQISADTLNDNNANATPGPGVAATDLCATSLENTAWYRFTVASNGPAVINLNKIQCDNDYGSNSTGFQIGFFTGSCLGLIPISCYSGSGSFVQATTAALTAGDNVYVAIDGTAGANCSYQINAINAVILATLVRDFSGWKLEKTNLLKWTGTEEKENTIYEIQRSENKSDFKTIGQLTNHLSSAKDADHEFEDKSPPATAYYRLKYIESVNKQSFSKIIVIKRNQSPISNVEIINPVSSILTMHVYSQVKADYYINVVNSLGQVVLTDKLNYTGDISIYKKQLPPLQSGIYHVIINDKTSQFVKTFFKD